MMSVRDFAQKEVGFKHPGKFKGFDRVAPTNGEVLDLITFKNWALPIQLLPGFMISVVSRRGSIESLQLGL